MRIAIGAKGCKRAPSRPLATSMVHILSCAMIFYISFSIPAASLHVILKRDKNHCNVAPELRLKYLCPSKDEWNGLDDTI